MLEIKIIASVLFALCIITIFAFCIGCGQGDFLKQNEISVKDNNGEAKVLFVTDGYVILEGIVTKKRFRVASRSTFVPGDIVKIEARNLRSPWQFVLLK